MEEGLALESGKEAKLRFLLLLAPQETFTVRPWCFSDPTRLTNHMVFHYWSKPGSASNIISNGDVIIDPSVPPNFHGHCKVDFLARRISGEQNEPVTVLNRLFLEVKNLRAFSFSGFFIFLFFTFFLYFIIAFYALPESLLPIIRKSPGPLWFQKILIIVFILIIGWSGWRFFLRDTRWFENKTFDDVIAISNASTLLCLFLS